jgi:hypothetical protein
MRTMNVTVEPPADADAELRLLAERYARTGAYFAWWEIEKALEDEGHANVRRALEDEEFRARLDTLCKAAREQVPV